LLIRRKIDDVSFEQAVLVDFPMQTAVAALHVFLGMGVPGSGNEDEKALIWGAGGAVGSYAVQYAKSVSGKNHHVDGAKYSFQNDCQR
jgi:NADPH:quinone reductase-like Zn-dependent oxidoreductase